MGIRDNGGGGAARVGSGGSMSAVKNDGTWVGFIV